MAGSHKRETNARFVPKAALVAAPVAVLATTSAVTVGVASSTSDKPATVLAAAAPTDAITEAVNAAQSSRPPIVSRSALRKSSKKDRADRKRLDGEVQKLAMRKAEERQEVTADVVADAEVANWTTAELNVFHSAGHGAPQVGTLDEGAKVIVTGRTRGGRAEIVLKGQPRWVNAAELTDEEPVDMSGTGGECTNGTSIASWVSPNLKKIHEAVCARFPSIRTYGTRTGAGDHGTGRAVDIMLSGPLGWQVANYLRENYREFGISYLIYEQKIWSVERGGEGWRGMSNRGSATANHFDHVHVSIY